MATPQGGLSSIANADPAAGQPLLQPPQANTQGGLSSIESATPTAGQVDPVAQARAMAMQLNPNDPMNRFIASKQDTFGNLLANQYQNTSAAIAPARAEEERLAAINSANREQFQQASKDQYSQERATALNWQALGQMGAAMLANPTNAWGAGQTAYMDARGKNQATLDAAKQQSDELGYTLGKDDYTAAAAARKELQAQSKYELEQYVKWQQDQATRNKERYKQATDSTGRVFDYEQGVGDPRLVLDSAGTTQQQETALASLGEQLRNRLPSSPDKEAKIAASVAEQRAQYVALNRGRKPYAGFSPEEVGALNSRAQNGDQYAQQLLAQNAGYTLNEDPSAPPFTSRDRAAIDADFAKMYDLGAFTKEDVKGLPQHYKENPNALEVEQAKLNMNRQADVALEDEKVARAKLTSTAGMLEASRAAVITGAETGFGQTYLNIIGSILSSAGVPEGLAKEATRGAVFKTTINNAVQELQNAAKGPQTEGDSLRFFQSLVGIDNSAAANAAIIKFLEAKHWKAQQEVDFRGAYSSMNESQSGASNKWQQWSSSTPTVLLKADGSVGFIQDYIPEWLEANKEAVGQEGVAWGKREAIKAWQKRAK